MGFRDFFLLPWRVARLELEMEALVAAFDNALNDLDAQITELQNYVTSDEENDAAEVQERTARLKTLLEQVREQAPAPADGPAEPADNGDAAQ